MLKSSKSRNLAIAFSTALPSDRLTSSAEFDAVHVNAEFVDQASDHDPLLARFTLDVPDPIELEGGNGKNTLTGGLGNDSLSGGNGKDTLFDFNDGSDLIGLSGGLTFKDLLITQGSGDRLSDTFISVTNSGEQLAILSNTSASTITSADFVV